VSLLSIFIPECFCALLAATLRLVLMTGHRMAAAIAEVMGWCRWLAKPSTPCEQCHHDDVATIIAAQLQQATGGDVLHVCYASDAGSATDTAGRTMAVPGRSRLAPARPISGRIDTIRMKAAERFRPHFSAQRLSFAQGCR